MKLENLFDNYECYLKNMKKELDELKNNYKNAKNNTIKFLEECNKVGIELVSIGTYTNKIKGCKGWDGNFARNCIFADEKSGDWPAIWRIAEMEEGKYNGGCGNSGQHQFNCAEFIEGIYQFKDGKWFKIEEDDVYEDED